LLLSGGSFPPAPNLIPKEFLIGIAMAVVIAPENSELQKTEKAHPMTFGALGGQQFWLSQLWGGENYFYAEISSRMHSKIGRLQAKQE
jgi:hypothetical protein